MNGDWPGHSATANRPPPAPLRRYVKCLLCPLCKARTCPLFTAKSGRRFYACPAPSPKDHKFFVWEDRLHLRPGYYEFVDVPYCGGCEAGLCRVRMEKFGDDAGRILLMCRVKEGKGSCGYKAWKDEVDMSAMGHVNESTASFEQALIDWIDADRLALMAFIDGGPPTLDSAEKNGQSDCVHAGPSTLVDFNGAGPQIIGLVEENRHRDDGPKDDAPSIDGPQLIPCRAATSRKKDELRQTEEKHGEYVGLVEENKERDDGPKDDARSIEGPQLIQCRGATSRKREELRRTEEKHGEYESMPQKRLRDGDLKECSWMTMAINQDLGPQLQGWWGRLVFDPLPGLKIPASGPPIDGAYLPLKPIDVALGKSLMNSGVKMTTDILETESLYDMACIVADSCLEPSCVDFDVPTCNDPFPKARRGSVLMPSVTKAFELAAKQLRNDLITLLETSNAKEHEKMILAAEATFNALDHLHFNYESFKESVNLFICRAKLLTEIELSMPNDDSCEDLEDLCYTEKMKLDELEFTHDLLVNKVAKKRKHLEVLKEEIHYTKDLLSRVEEDLSCGLKELKDMEEQKEKLLIEKEVLGVKYLYDSQKLEDCRIFHESMEIEHEAAKAGFDKARALLRG